MLPCQPLRQKMQPTIDKNALEWRWRWLRGADLATALVLMAVDLFAFMGLRYIAVEMESVTGVVMLSLFLGLPLIMVHLQWAQSVSSTTVVRAETSPLKQGARIDVRWGPIWGGSRTISAADIKTLFTGVASRGGNAVCAALHDGTNQIVARHLRHEQAQALAHQLADYLGIALTPSSGAAPKKSTWRAWLLGLAGAGGVAAGGYLVTLPVQRTEGTSLLNGPITLSVRADAGETFSFWTATDVDTPPSAGRPRLYHYMDRVLVDIRASDQAGRTVQLACDPFETSFSDWQSSDQGLRATRWKFVSRMDGCAFKAPAAGPWRIEAQLRRLRDGKSFRFKRLELVIRSSAPE